MEKNRFSNLLINWYKVNKRPLPWRETQDSYRIWLSEVILQQTRVAQGLPYFLRFLSCFPDIKTLANASEKEVLRQWQGLGYYSRARNMHKAAKTIVSAHNGNFPTSYQKLLKIPGIGPYTAAAIASFAFNEQVAVLDGNVFRVIARIFGEKSDILSTAGKKKFQKRADSLLPQKNSGVYNQAIMEFGALQCLPKNPQCSDCPFNFMCYAYSKNKQDSLPVKKKKLAAKKRFFHYLVIKKSNKFLLKERAKSDIWQGLYDFPLLEMDSMFEIGKLLKTTLNLSPTDYHILAESKPYKHILSHQTLHVKFWIIESAKLQKLFPTKANYHFYNREELVDIPKPILIHKFLEEYVF